MGSGATTSRLYSETNSLILSCKYHCLSADRPVGTMTSDMSPTFSWCAVLFAGSHSRSSVLVNHLYVTVVDAVNRKKWNCLIVNKYLARKDTWQERILGKKGCKVID